LAVRLQKVVRKIGFRRGMARRLRQLPHCLSERHQNLRQGRRIMPRGDKSSYTEKQQRQAEHIEEGYEERGVPDEEAERRAWATVNKMTGGGKKSGSGRGKEVNKAPAKKGGRIGGAASAARSPAEKSASAKKAARTRARNKSRSGASSSTAGR
jgi:plasmid stabilization system protein ParE